MIRVAVVGASGRMGLCLIKAAELAEKTTLSAAISRSASGKDAGDLAGIGTLDISISDALEKVLDQFDVLIDFTRPEPSMDYIELCRKAGKKIVIGTTGYTDAQKMQIAAAAKDIAIVIAPNMSVGVNVCFKLLKDMAKTLGDGFDVEIVELHHNKKKDSPSGTAVRMGEIVADALDRDYNQVANYHREGMCGERTSEEIGMQTVRGGDIVGEHTVYFIGMGERIELTHRAMSRDMFARGAVRAAGWLGGKKAGLYDMQDVLGLK